MISKITEYIYGQHKIQIIQTWTKIELWIDGNVHDKCDLDASKIFVLKGSINGEPVEANIKCHTFRAHEFRIKVNGTLLKQDTYVPLNNFYNPYQQSTQVQQKETIIKETLVKIRCTYCRTLNNDVDIFCVNCGAKL
jgi:hypothetical protein